MRWVLGRIGGGEVWVVRIATSMMDGVDDGCVVFYGIGCFLRYGLFEWPVLVQRCWNL